MIGVGSRSSAGSNRTTEREHWIALSLLPGIGPVGFASLRRSHGSSAAAWRAGAAGLEGLPRGIDPKVATSWLQQDPRALARSVERATAAAGGRVVTGLDPTYPRALLTLDPQPPTLFIAGDDAALQERAVAIVGTRSASGYGLATATDLGDELARAGMTVVSGLALGIDGAAHRAAVEAGGRSVAVLPSPLDRVYPPRHRGLAGRIVAAGGALITEMPVGAGVGRPDFARRNRIIAGLAEAVVVVEAPSRSGALLTAQAASTIGREVYAVPGPIDAMGSRGSNRLIADHQAVIVTSTADVLRQIGAARAEPPPAMHRLSEVEGQVLQRLLERSGSLEELVDRTRHAPAAVASAVTLLEARGLANSFGGATFHPTLAARRLAGLV